MSEWFYTSNHQQVGPVSSRELKQLAESGTLKPGDLVWREGLANWVKAGATKGLFPADVPELEAVDAEPVEEEEESPRTRTRRRREDDDAPRRRRSVREDDPDAEERERPVRTSASSDSDEDDAGDDDDRPIRRKRRKRQSSGAGLKIGLAIGGGVLLIIALVVVLVVVLNQPSSPNGSRTFSLRQGANTWWNISFNAQHVVSIQVRSNGESDVDLYVFDASGREVAHDDGFSKDCNVAFLANATQRYKVEVRNMVLDVAGRNGSNSGTVTYTQVPLGEAQVPPNQPPRNIPPPRNFPGKLGKLTGVDITDAKLPLAGVIERSDPRDPRQPMNPCKLYLYPMTAGKDYIITMDGPPPLDPFLRVEDPNGIHVALDDDGGENLNARLVFRPNITGTYRIYASSLGGSPGNFTLNIAQQ